MTDLYFDTEGSGMLMFNDIIPILDKYWRNYENYQQELKEACLAFGKLSKLML